METRRREKEPLLREGEGEREGGVYVRNERGRGEGVWISAESMWHLVSAAIWP
jgi:hypothetical protein